MLIEEIALTVRRNRNSERADEMEGFQESMDGRGEVCYKPNCGEKRLECNRRTANQKTKNIKAGICYGYFVQLEIHVQFLR